MLNFIDASEEWKRFHEIEREYIRARQELEHKLGYDLSGDKEVKQSMDITPTGPRNMTELKSRNWDKWHDFFVRRPDLIDRRMQPDTLKILRILWNHDGDKQEVYDTTRYSNKYLGQKFISLQKSDWIDKNLYVTEKTRMVFMNETDEAWINDYIEFFDGE